MYPPVPRPQSHTGAIVAAVLTGVWLVTVAVASQLIMWLVAQIMIALGLEVPGWGWLIVAVLVLLLAGLPALLLARIPKHRPTREAGRAWMIAAGTLTAGCALRMIPEADNALFLLAFAIVAAIAAFLVRRRAAAPVVEEPIAAQGWGNPAPLWAPPPPPAKELPPPAGPFPGAAGLGAVAGLLVLVPFLLAGALGGLLETVFAVFAAAALGALAASTLDYGFWTTYDRGTARRVWLGGLTGGVALAMFAASAGGNGLQLLLMLILPPLAFAAAALKRTWPMIGIAAVGPLAFFDPVEVAPILLAGEEIPYWAMMTALGGLGIALLVGLVYGLGLFRTPRPIALGTAAALTAAAAALYIGAGQTGFYGNQLFVVLKDQADLSGIPATTGLGPARDSRVAAVYQRLVEHANRTQADLRAELDRFNLSYRPYYLVNAILVTGGPATEAWLNTRSEVDRVLLDQRLRPLPRALAVSKGDSTTPPASPMWNIQMVGAPGAWQQGFTGRGIVVGSSDSGADGGHPALSATFRGGGDSWYDPWNHSAAPVDHGGHGTHTLATAVGKQNVGVAPDAQWVSCVNLDRNLGSPSFYLDCMQFMLAPFPLGGNPLTDGRPARAPHVLTNSWGCPPLEGCDLTVTRPATGALAAAGIAFVAAAGNSGDRCGSIDTPPATDPASFTVAAVDRSRAVASFSSRGVPGSGKPDISAPGEQIFSAMPGGTYTTNSGTSMATPHVAGVVALLWSARPDLVGNLTATYDLLRDAAQPAAAGALCGGAEDYGAGIITYPR